MSQRKKEAMPKSNQRMTPIPFASDEARQIGNDIAAGRAPACPGCKGHLALEEPLERGDGRLIRAVRCETCGRTAILTTPPKAPSD